jgi:hypothetical protein
MADTWVFLVDDMRSGDNVVLRKSYQSPFRPHLSGPSAARLGLLVTGMSTGKTSSFTFSS